MRKRKFGRLYYPDKRDLKFLMKPDLKKASKIEYRYHYVGDPLDQGESPRCVGFSGYKYLTAGPVRNTKLPFTAGGLYKLAQENDEWEGTNYEGTSVRGLFKYLNKAGYIQRYEWAFDVEVIAAHILTVGPVVVGTNWFEGMEKPDSKEVLEVSGGILGGHAYVLCGCNRKKKLFRMINSWGKWGSNGKAWIRFEDFKKLIEDEGEACVATEIDLDKKGGD